MSFKLSTRTRSIAGFLLALAILGEISWLLYSNAHQVERLRQSIRRNREVLDALQGLETNIQDAESGQRGYLITGDESYLVPYQRATSQIEGNLQKLEDLSASHSNQRQRIAELAAHVSAKTAELQQTEELRRRKNPEAARRIVLSGVGKHEMAQIRNLIVALKAEQIRQIDQQRYDYETRLATTNRLLALGVAVQFLLLVLVFISFQRDLAYRDRSARELDQANSRFTAILSALGEGVYQLDHKGSLLYLNRACERLFGYEMGEVAGKRFHDIIHSHAPSGKLLAFDACPVTGVIRDGVSYTSPEDWFQRKDGTFITVEYTAMPLKTAGGAPGAVVSFRDISERRRREERLQATTELQQAILRSANVGIMSMDTNGIITTFNPAAERMLQYQASQVVGKITPLVFHDQEEVGRRAQELNRELHASVPPGPEALTAKAGQLGLIDKAEWTYIRKDGSRFPVSISISALRDVAGSVNGFLAIIEDITERRNSEAALRQSEAMLTLALEREKDDARIDFLTRIHNRRALYEAALSEITRARRYHRPVTLVYIDLDNFKHVNDTLGHMIGDELLVEVAATLRSNVRTTDIVGRLGGDEFALLLPETNQDAATVVVDKVRVRLLMAMQLKNWPVTFSFGVASFASPPASVDELIKHADEAMYLAKLQGKNTVVSASAGAVS